MSGKIKPLSALIAAILLIVAIVYLVLINYSKNKIDFSSGKAQLEQMSKTEPRPLPQNSFIKKRAVPKIEVETAPWPKPLTNDVTSSGTITEQGHENVPTDM